VRERGKVSEAMKAAFFAAGWDPQHALEVILGIAIKIMSNYTNAIVGVPLDAAVQDEH